MFATHRWVSARQKSQIAKFMGPTWGPLGSCRPPMGPMLAPWILLSGLTALLTQWSYVFLALNPWHGSSINSLSHNELCNILSTPSGQGFVNILIDTVCTKCWSSQLLKCCPKDVDKDILFYSYFLHCRLTLTTSPLSKISIICDEKFWTNLAKNPLLLVNKSIKHIWSIYNIFSHEFWSL